MDKQKTKAQLPKEPDFEFLNPKDISVFRHSGRLRLSIRDDRSYIEVKPVRSFPISDASRYIGLLDGKDRVIGIIQDPTGMDPETQQCITAELKRRYFTPSIERIVSMKEEYGVHYLNVKTDHGSRRFVVKGIRDQLLSLDGGGYLISDVDGNRYRLVNWHRMDSKSRRYLEQFM